MLFWDRKSDKGRKKENPKIFLKIIIAKGKKYLKGQDWNRWITEKKLRGKGNRDRGKVKQGKKEN